MSLLAASARDPVGVLRSVMLLARSAVGETLTVAPMTTGSGMAFHDRRGSPSSQRFFPRPPPSLIERGIVNNCGGLTPRPVSPAAAARPCWEWSITTLMETVIQSSADCGIRDAVVLITLQGTSTPAGSASPAPMAHTPSAA